MDDITFVRSHWWLVSEGFSLSTALDFTQNPGKVMDDITFVRSHWWLVSEGFSLGFFTIDRQLRCTETPRHSVPSYCRFPRLCRLKCVKHHYARVSGRAEATNW